MSDQDVEDRSRSHVDCSVGHDDRVLKARAKALAKPLEQTEQSGPVIQVVEFSIGAENYAVEVSFVREVCALRSMTTLPGAPPFVQGITDVRGEFIPVMDLGALLDLDVQDAGNGKTALIMYKDELVAGLPINEVSGVRSVPVNSVQSSVVAFGGGCQQYFKGVTVEGTTILDAEKLLLVGDGAES